MSYAPASRPTLKDETGDKLGRAGTEVDRRLGVLSPGTDVMGRSGQDGTFYEELGAARFDRRRPDAQARHLVKRLANLGFSVDLKPMAAVT